jgi:Tfp pilus assembly protein PilF
MIRTNILSNTLPEMAAWRLPFIAFVSTILVCCTGAGQPGPTVTPTPTNTPTPPPLGSETERPYVYQSYVYQSRGDTYVEQGEHQKAITEYSTAIELGPERLNAYLSRGYAYNQLGKYRKAIADFDKAILLDPGDAKAYNNRGIAHHELGEYQKAIADYSRAIEIDPQYAKAYYNRGIAHDELGEYQKAIDDYRKVLEITDDPDLTRDAQDALEGLEVVNDGILDTPKGKEKHRADLILLCNALQIHAQLDYEYNNAVNNWEPNFDDNDFGPELSELAIFDKTLNLLISATYELPKTKVADAIDHNDKRRQYYYQQQKAWGLLADSYETRSEIKYNLFTNTYDDSIDSYDDYSQLWQSIASEYYFDDWTCARTDGTPRLASTINDLNNTPLAEQMATIANQINTMRGLTTTNEASSNLMTRDEFRVYNEEEWFKDYDEEENNDSLTTLILLGLVDPDFDLKQMYLDSYGTNVLGFYDKDENTLVTISDTDSLTDAGKSTYAHEHMHALQFNTYDLEDIGLSDEGWEADSERAAAIQAVIEGEATLIETLWKEAVFTSKNYDNEIEPLDVDTEAPDTSEPELPTWHLLDAYFPYGNGYNFVANVYSIGGWDAVNKLYEKPPVSTEMIMHPQKYWDDDVPIPVDAVNIKNALGQDWQKVESGVMGEFWTYLILREYIAEHHARIAAAGWGGDSYTVARNESNNQTFLAIDWVFDSTKDITEFYKAITTYNNSRFGNIDRQYMSSNQICSTGVLNSCVFQTGSTNIRWIVTPSIELIDKIFNEMSGDNVDIRPTP